MNNYDVSIVVPTLNAVDRLPVLLDSLFNQSVRPSEVLVVDSMSTDGTLEVASKFPDVKVLSVDRRSFNHGLTRHFAFLSTDSEFVGFLTDDAVPVNRFYLENILSPFEDEAVAMISGRQIAKSDARPFEKLVRAFNYGEESNIRTLDDVERIGIKAYFSSDACSMYRRSHYLEVGGFKEVNTNEDMLIAATFLQAGFKVGYEANAEVYHSHNLTPSQQFHRNRAVGQFLELNNDFLNCGNEIGEGASLVKSVSRQLLSQLQLKELGAFGFDCAARLLGNRIGRYEARNMKGGALQ